MVRCLIFDRGLSGLGGGERYAFALGDVIAETHDVIYATDGPLPERSDLERFGYRDVHITHLPMADVALSSLEFDLAVVLTGGQPPPFRSKHRLAVIHFPFHDLPTGWVRRARALTRLRRSQIVVYSEFSRRWLNERWRVDAEVLPPPVELPAGETPPKEKLILSVGRFFAGGNDKRQDVLLEAFATMTEQDREGWRLVLAGGHAPGPHDEFLERLHAAASGLDISIELNVSAARLSELYDKARFYWHAAGYERAANTPERAEHFGMTTVEAMSHRAIPLVYADGGQLEIVTPSSRGVVWRSIPELVSETVALMRCSDEELDARAAAARRASEVFAMERFQEAARRTIDRCVSRRALPSSLRHLFALPWRLRRWLVAP